MESRENTEFVPSPEEIKDILSKSKVIAVVGLSNDRMRPSNRIGKFLKVKGYKVIPVNPNYDSVLDLKSYPTLLDVPEEIDIVDIFRKPEAVGDVVSDAIKKGVKVVWMQEGIINIDAAQKAKEAGITVVMDRCIYKEYDIHFMRH
ncbi:MAG: CoA-binding protein [Thermoplasmata archaeon]|nr:MAG: CoA-binding protein [Thermoplasmata archaeon]